MVTARKGKKEEADVEKSEKILMRFQMQRKMLSYT